MYLSALRNPIIETGSTAGLFQTQPCQWCGPLIPLRRRLERMYLLRQALQQLPDVDVDKSEIDKTIEGLQTSIDKLEDELSTRKAHADAAKDRRDRAEARRATGPGGPRGLSRRKVR